MNTFFRQKLTNKTIDLLEKVEDRKTREEEEDCLILESPTILAIISLHALIILGIIVPIIAIPNFFSDIWYDRSGIRSYPRSTLHSGRGLSLGIGRNHLSRWNWRLADRIFLILESCDRS